MNNKGFSLIELSIVLIVVGLLITVLVGGSSLIKSVEINRVCDYFVRFKTAYNTYYSVYGRLAGVDGDYYMLMDDLEK